MARDLDAQVGGDAGRTGHQVVAAHDGDGVAVTGVDRVHVAPDLGLVHDVVVVERGQVHQFHRDPAEEVLAVGLAVAHGGRRDGQDGPQSLPTGVDQVRRDLIEVGVAENNRFGQERFQAHEVSLDRGKA